MGKLLTIADYRAKRAERALLKACVEARAADAPPLDDIADTVILDSETGALDPAAPLARAAIAYRDAWLAFTCALDDAEIGY